MNASPAADPQIRFSEGGFAIRHHLMVLATDCADAVAAAGGLIFDRVGAGWDVQIYLEQAHEPADDRALQILGIRKRLPTLDIAPDRWPDFILVSAKMYADNTAVRRLFGVAARRPRTEVAIWGGEWPTGLEPGIGGVEHRLSVAAKAFKSHALTAVGLPETMASETESFRNGKRRFEIAAPLLPSS